MGYKKEIQKYDIWGSGTYSEVRNFVYIYYDGILKLQYDKYNKEIIVYNDKRLYDKIRIVKNTAEIIDHMETLNNGFYDFDKTINSKRLMKTAI